jgi:hypothetical protein
MRTIPARNDPLMRATTPATDSAESRKLRSAGEHDPVTSACRPQDRLGRTGGRRCSGYP